jgi:outer membrane immunogenic protein
MKKLILGTVALSAAGLVNVASAADMPLKAPAIAPVVYNWTGCYVGINGGFKWARFNESVDTTGGSVVIPGVGLIPFAPGHVDLDHATASSGAVGGQIGCRWENAEHWVFGAEGDFDWTRVNASVTDASPPTTGLFPGITFDNRIRWEGSGRIILGRSFDRWLVYGTGGIAFARVDMDANFPAVTMGGGAQIPAFFASDSKTLVGGTVGLGTAYMLTRNWEIGAEYRYTFYAQSDYNLGTPTAFCARPLTTLAPPTPVCAITTATGHKGAETQEVLFKLNYRFDWGGPVVARY